MPMAYSNTLADRLRDCLDSRPDVVERKMFGGMGYLLHGNMFTYIWQDYLVLRLGPEEGSKALSQPQVRTFDIISKSIKAWVMIHERDLEDDTDLKKWLRLALEFVASLPPK
jgi:TfoX/Sxy family transcriptional regulator of competence genes